MANLLVESGSAPVKSGNNWRAVLITPGKGSSGIYTESMLKEYGPKAFKRGTHSYVDHPQSETEVRSPKNLIGVLAEDAYYEEGTGLVAELDVMPHWKEFVEAVAPHTGLSIYAMGEGNYNDDGEIVVENLIPHTQNSVDLVSYPGRPGSKLADKLYEQAVAMVDGDAVEEAYHGGKKMKDAYKTKGAAERRAKELGCEGTHSMEMDGETMYMACSTHDAYEKALEASAPMGGKEGAAAATAAETIEEQKEGNSMELKELSEQIAELPNLVAAAVAEALAPAEEPEEDEVDVEAVAEAMVEADLPEVSRKAVYESLKAGGDLAAAIEAQKGFVESVKAHFKEEAKAAPAAEETVIVNTEEKAPRLSEILNVKVGA